MENGFYEEGEERRQAERENVTQAKVREKVSKGKEREITDGEESKKKGKRREGTDDDEEEVSEEEEEIGKGKGNENGEEHHGGEA